MEAANERARPPDHFHGTGAILKSPSLPKEDGQLWNYSSESRFDVMMTYDDSIRDLRRKYWAQLAGLETTGKAAIKKRNLGISQEQAI